ncbi:hypothetical protein J2Z69_001807 [Paenibacillus shirakamiensis]|uniref:Uncharacterized protein n=1 Tax=Paenibacillus shirakamiensis TaxID=1265935 RepID=A0ABS4JI34_9BACL|nr:hypothetical protein [Paenibacillus shirakamiensis]MBP2000776.1 hypothetical protein [Paenibacillus shirakamiensis]
MRNDLVNFLLIVNKLLILSRYKMSETNGEYILSILNLIQRKSVQFMLGRREALDQLIEEALCLEEKNMLNIEHQYPINSKGIISINQRNRMYQYLQIVNLVIEEIKDLILLNKYQQAYDLIDAIHCLPEIIVLQNWNERDYWKNFIYPYREKWDSYFLVDVEQAIGK